MAGQKGRLFKLKVDITGSGSFSTIGGLRPTSFVINNTEVDVTDKDSSGKRELLEDGGIQSMAITAGGVFKDSASEETIRGYAAAASIDDYQIVAPNGDVWEGAFLITSYERNAGHDDEEQFSISLASSGAITFTPA